MGAALCLILPFCLLINRPKDYYKPRYDAAYYGCQEPITITYTDKNKKEKKYLAYCGEKVVYGNYYCANHQYYL